MKIKPIEYPSQNLSDDELKQAAAQYLGRSSALQVVAEFLGALRRYDPPEPPPQKPEEAPQPAPVEPEQPKTADDSAALEKPKETQPHPIPELSPEMRRELLPAQVRMQALERRPDLRQTVVTTLTGVPKNTARNRMNLEDQIRLMNQVIDEHDRTARQFDVAFDAAALAIHMDGAVILNSLWEKFQWKQDSAERKGLVASFIESLLKIRSDEPEQPPELKPVLIPRDVLRVIGTELLLDRLPKDLQRRLFDAWLDMDEKDEPFRPRHFLEIVALSELVKHIELADLKSVILLGIEKMGFAPEEKITAPREESSQATPPPTIETTDGPVEDQPPKA